MINIKKLTEFRPLDNYTRDQIKNILLLSSSTKNPAKPFGSATFRIQKYPGDLDLHEVFIECCTKEEVFNKFAKILQEIVNKVKQEKMHYITEVKVGLDNRFDVDIGEINNGIFNIDKNSILNKVNELKKNYLLNDKELGTINVILNKINPGANEYDVLTYIFRENRILRWTMYEILVGYKQLKGGYVMTLEKALSFKSHVKIDMVTYVNDKFVEITNWFVLALKKPNGILKTLNLDYNWFNNREAFNNYEIQMKQEIEKLYYSNIFFNPFKMCKRLWVLSKTKNDIELIKDLTPVVTGNISLLYQIKSEMEAMINIMDKIKYTLETINKQMDIIKSRLSHVIEIDYMTLEILDIVINKFIVTNNEDIKKEIMLSLYNYFKDMINDYTLEEMERIGLNPPPRQFLPKHMKYNFNLHRESEVDVINPLLIYGLK